MKKTLLVTTILALVLTGCVSRATQIRMAQNECAQMGFGGDQLAGCTLSEVQHEDNDRRSRIAAALGFWAMTRPLHTTCWGNSCTTY